MAKKMLIDASHSEETRVAIINGNRIEEFDFESSTKKQLKGSIYLAKVIRIEPSLQAAFVEFGSNNHGFLPFSEIQPDYYRIPVEDRLARGQAKQNNRNFQGNKIVESIVNDHSSNNHNKILNNISIVVGGKGVIDFTIEYLTFQIVVLIKRKDFTDSGNYTPLYKRYKIQEVIKRRQIMLIQVNKEERGNKGAALTTYLSIAGRYGILMPNSPNSGGVSKKITNLSDRQRLRSLLQEIVIPSSMSLIIRTAGISRTEAN